MYTKIFIIKLYFSLWSAGNAELLHAVQCVCNDVMFVQSLQQLEERRVGKIQEYIQKSADIENDAIPIINTCIAGIVSTAKTVSPAEVFIISVT